MGLIDFINWISKGTLALLGVGTGILLYIWLRPFLLQKKYAVFTGAAYTACAFLCWKLPLNMGSFGVWIKGVLIFLGIYLPERRNREQKIFLSILFIAIARIAYGFSGEVNYLATYLVSKSRFFTDNIGPMIGEFVLQEALWLLLSLSLLSFAILLFHKVFERKYENMTWTELAVTLPPALLVFLMGSMERRYLELWGKGILNGTIRENYPGNLSCVFYNVAAYLVILTVVSFYQKDKQKSEEIKEAALLDLNRAALEAHIENVESLYEEQRRLRHDLANHIQTMEGLIKAGESASSGEYLDAMKRELKNGDPGPSTGNPVTDIILAEYAAKAKERGVRFEADFSYPAGGRVRAFDVSVILNNALDNALRAAEACPDPYIRVCSIQKKRLLFLDVANNYGGFLSLDEKTGLPDQVTGQGIGLKNIRHMAEKYGGAMDIELARREGEREFRLTVMLQTG